VEVRREVVEHRHHVAGKGSAVGPFFRQGAGLEAFNNLL
jgi:hypothetical protein